jgi:hypothetical protein
MNNHLDVFLKQANLPSIVMPGQQDYVANIHLTIAFASQLPLVHMSTALLPTYLHVSVVLRHLAPSPQVSSAKQKQQ